MAVGFTPKHIEDYPLNELTEAQFLIIALETAEKMAWKFANISDSGFDAYTDKGFFSWNAEVKISVNQGVAQLKSISVGNEMMDWGKNKKNIATFLSNFNIVKSSLSIEEINDKYEQIKPNLSPKAEELPPTTFIQEVKDFFSIFIPVKEFFITPLLIDINIIIFILMIINGVSIMSPSSESLINWGANFKPATLDNQAWRLITNCFLHIGIFHLLMNMYALLYVGILLEPILGKTRFLSAYLLTGITASLTSLWWHDLTVSAGASGAIFGMYGVFLALLTTKLIEENARKALLSSIGIFVAFNLMYGLKGGIDNAAHIGGLVGGFLLGYAFLPSLKAYDNQKLKYTTIGLLTTLIAVISFVLYQKIPNDIGIYSKKMDEFTSMEAKALEVYQLADNSPNDTILDAYKNKGIYYWNENIKLINGLKLLNLPEAIRLKNDKLKQYSEARLAFCELYYKAIKENTDKYNADIEKANKDIETILKDLNEKEDK
jgi:rhomboid protease GluP